MVTPKPNHQVAAAGNSVVTVIEKCRITPPPNTVGERSLPLTFLDFGWLPQPPIEQLFFYEFRHSKPHFIQTVLPNLKHSLSITLQHFFPLAGNLIVFPDPDHSSFTRKPEIQHVEGDSVELTFVECSLDFNDLTGNHPRECDKFHPLVCHMGQSVKVSDNIVAIPLFSVQVTVFPDSGFSIGITHSHSLFDASSKFIFLKAWSSIAKTGTDELFLASGSSPLYDRLIEYPKSLDELCFNLPGMPTVSNQFQLPQHVKPTGKLRATITLTGAHINGLKKWVSTQLPELEYISSFTVACGYAWSCIAKSRAHIGETKGDDDDDLEMFGCVADWRARFDPPIPPTYFGNCLVTCTTTPTKTRLLSGNKGFLVAVESLGKAIMSEVVNGKHVGIVERTERWSERPPINVPAIWVSGTPKLKIYDLDFGWGKPAKFEVISLDYNDSISVNACKESPEDIDIGLSLSATQMDAFIQISKNELKNIIHEENE